MQIITRTATRYVPPLREGGSLPASVETDGGGLLTTMVRVPRLPS